MLLFKNWNSNLGTEIHNPNCSWTECVMHLGIFLSRKNKKTLFTFKQLVLLATSQWVDLFRGTEILIRSSPRPLENTKVSESCFRHSSFTSSSTFKLSAFNLVLPRKLPHPLPLPLKTLMLIWSQSHPYPPPNRPRFRLFYVLITVWGF